MQVCSRSAASSRITRGQRTRPKANSRHRAPAYDVDQALGANQRANAPRSTVRGRADPGSCTDSKQFLARGRNRNQHKKTRKHMRASVLLITRLPEALHVLSRCRSLKLEIRYRALSCQAPQASSWSPERFSVRWLPIRVPVNGPSQAQALACT